MQDYLDVLAACPLFEGVARQDIRAMLQCLEARDVALKRGQAVFRADSPAEYALSLFRDWYFYNLHTQEDVEDYLANREIAYGKAPGYGITQSEARAEMEKRIKQT